LIFSFDAITPLIPTPFPLWPLSPLSYFTRAPRLAMHGIRSIPQLK
jgi:hypothetical protein